LTEPNENWTIEELVNWSLAQYQTKTAQQADQYIEKLREICNKECDDIMELHARAVEMAQNNENAATTAKSPKTSRGDLIEVLVTTGDHADSRFCLRPKPDIPCLIGRSRGKKFAKNGISLHKDQEVSTTHAKIIVEGLGLADNNGSKEVKFYFVDVGSTNGSTLGGEMLEPEKKVLIEEGMEIKVGGSTLKFVLG
jgi:hypothetical protein